MEVIPAIDIRNGKCVRLMQGDFKKEVVYAKTPIEMARLWDSHGANWIHVVDLDGAREGKPCNLSLIEEMIAEVDIPIQLGGGIRTLDIIEQYLNIGIARVILGTAALEKPEMVEKAVDTYGAEKIVAGVDAKEGKVAIKGWLETSEKTVIEVIRSLKEKGVKTFIYTDISRDGMLSGPDMQGLKELINLNDIEIIASGGVSSTEDLEKLSEIGINYAVVGKALYDLEIDFKKIWK